MKGKVKWFDSAKGYGFIQTDDGNEVFVHYSGIIIEDKKNDGYRKLKQGQTVSFEITEGQKGPQAVDVKIEEM